MMRPVLAVLGLAALTAPCQRHAAPNNAAALTPVPTTAATYLPPAPPSSAEVAYAPPPQSLRAPRRRFHYAYAPRPRLYDYIDDAYWVTDVYYPAPPDYAFDYYDWAPVVWLDGAYVVFIAEPVIDGVRFYYYRPGYDWPFYVQDPYYGYGYDNGVLTVVYDSAGVVLDPAFAATRVDIAGRYFARGED